MESDQPDVRTFLFNVRRIKDELGISQRELARRAGITSGYCSQVWNDQVPGISLMTAIGLAQALNTTVDALLGSQHPCPHTRIERVGADGATCVVCGARLTVTVTVQEGKTHD